MVKKTTIETSHSYFWVTIATIMVLTFITGITFGSRSNLLGFYSDDSGFLISLGSIGLWDTLSEAKSWVAGRNLQVIWQQIFFLIAGHGPEDLPKLHILQTVLDCISCILFFMILRRLRLSYFASFCASVLFSLYPNHGETHFWPFSAPMNGLSTLFLLAYLWLALYNLDSSGANSIGRGRLALTAELLMFVCAMFTYDQVFFILLSLFLLRIGILFSRISINRHGIFLVAKFCLPYVVCILGFLFAQISRSFGPTFEIFSVYHYFRNILFSIHAFLQPLALGLARQIDCTADFTAVLLVGLLVCAFSGLLILLETRYFKNETSSPNEFFFAERRLLTFFIATGLFFVAYLPAYIWYIAPRHNYPPTIFACIAGAIAIDSLLNIADRRFPKWGRTFSSLTAILLITIYSFAFACYASSEKQQWIDSYQYRKNFYNDLATNGILQQLKPIYLDGFPNNIGTFKVQFFGSESSNALLYLHPTDFLTRELFFDAVESPVGYFIGVTNPTPTNLAHIKENEILRVKFISAANGRIQYEVAQHTPEEYQRFYSLLRAVPQQSDETQDFHVVAKGNNHVSIELDFDKLGSHIGEGEVLALVMYDCSQGTEKAWSYLNTTGLQLLVPVLIDRGTGRKRLDYKLHMPVNKPCKAQLLQVGRDSRKLLREVPIIQKQAFSEPKG